jgi:hypothetical protein
VNKTKYELAKEWWRQRSIGLDLNKWENIDPVDSFVEGYRACERHWNEPGGRLPYLGAHVLVALKYFDTTETALAYVRQKKDEEGDHFLCWYLPTMNREVPMHEVKWWRELPMTPEWYEEKENDYGDEDE